MTTATKSKKTTKKPEARSAKLMQLGTSTILWLTRGRNVTAYRVTAIRHDFGKAAFTLEKANKGTEPAATYEVLLDGSNSTCSCPGNTFCGHCVHVESLTALQKAGKLPATQAKLADSAVQIKPESEEEETIELTEQPPQPADEQDNYCPTCGCHYREHIAGFCPR